MEQIKDMECNYNIANSQGFVRRAYLLGYATRKRNKSLNDKEMRQRLSLEKNNLIKRNPKFCSQYFKIVLNIKFGLGYHDCDSGNKPDHYHK